MTLMAIGVSHKSAPLSLRERVAVGTEQLPLALQSITEQGPIEEAVLLSTCNRTELYFTGSSLQPLLRWLVQAQQILPLEMKKHGYVHTERSAVAHLMRVACGLDSMVLGEADILGQLKMAYNHSCDIGCVGKELNRLFQFAFAVAKQVRTETEIGLNPVSVANTAVRLAKQIFTDIKQSKVLVVGAGNTAKSLLKQLVGLGVDSIYVANRTQQRSRQLIEELVQPINCQLIELQQIPEVLPEVDIVISATASPLPIIGKGMMEGCIVKRRYRPILMIDLAVPRDIEPEVGKLSDIYLYCVDDLQSMTENNQLARQRAADQAENIILSQSDKFSAWLRSQDTIARLRNFRQTFAQIKQETVAEGLRDLKLGKQPGDVLNRMAELLTNRITHQPTVSFREACYLGDEQLMNQLEQIFSISKDNLK